MTVVENPPERKRRLLVLLPLVAFLALAALFFYRLGSGDPSRIPSALIGREAPPTDLPAGPGSSATAKPVPGIVPADFKGAVTILTSGRRGACPAATRRRC
jgi:cytochrome c biogenesis protein CcmG/thiol:disulfide interchange protein DsbE